MRCVGASILLLLTAFYIQDAAAQQLPVCSEVSFKKCGSSDDWFHMKGKRCVTVIKEKLSFEKAKAACEKNGGALASLNFNPQLKTAFCLVKKSFGNDERFWVGATMTKDGGFEWFNKKYFSERLFVKGQPDNTNGEEHCLEMNWKEPFRFNDDRCVQEKYAVCEKGIKEF